MCLSCGCGRPTDDHGDSRHLVLVDLTSAAAAAGCSVQQAVANILSGLAGTDADAAKALPADTVMCRVVKAEKPRRYSLGVAYPAMKPDVSRAADGHKDFVRPEVLEKTAWEWLAKHREINLFHSDGSSGHCTPVESYIYRGPDWVQVSPVDGKTYVVKAGDWMLGGIWDEYGWSLVEAALVNGWSPEGGARRSVPTPELLAQLRS